MGALPNWFNLSFAQQWSLWAPGRMKRTWRQREAPGGVALHQLTSLLQGLRLGHSRVAQVRARVHLLGPCAPGGDLGCARMGEKVGQCGVETRTGKEKGWCDVCRLALGR